MVMNSFGYVVCHDASPLCVCLCLDVPWLHTPHTTSNPHQRLNRQQREDPLTFMQQALPGVKQKVVLKLAALPREMQQGASGGGGGGRACDEVRVVDGLRGGGMGVCAAWCFSL